jgi:hypothetical protein
MQARLSGTCRLRNGSMPSSRIFSWEAVRPVGIVAEKFRAARSDIPIVYTSGNAVDQARKVSGSVFFGKPCRTLDILRVCRTFGGPSALNTEPRARETSVLEPIR